MNILLIGGGGREHALCWKLAQSPLVKQIYASPGNPGINALAIATSLDIADHQAVVQFCGANAVDLVVIGPEAPLVEGLGDSLREAGIHVFGPSAAAAQLEGSKGFTKDMCARFDIPTAGYVRVHNAAEGRAALAGFGLPVVIKADGLAAGKGVIIAETPQEAEEAIGHMFAGGFGDAGAQVVIEEFMSGEEASFFAITDGETIIPFGSAQDHKRVGEGDTGPNTGGMGAYSPAPVLTAALEAQVMATIIEPTVRAMTQMGHPYSGVLYAGLILTQDGPKLIEYNCRFGDPECQVLMMRLQSDLAEIMLATAQGTLASSTPPRFSNDTALTVVMAAKGYPGTPQKGGAINLPATDSDNSSYIFHAGTKMNGQTLVANGGRVLNVTATGQSATQAQQHAYAVVAKINFPEGFYRGDIGWREVERERG